MKQKRMSTDELQKNIEILPKKDTVELQSELKHSESVEQFIQENRSEFTMMSVSDYLNELLIKYNLEKCDVGRRGGFIGNYSYQIFSGKKNASRDKLIQIALGFPLPLEETQQLLHFGGYAELYIRNRRDAFLMFALEKQYTVREVNDLLFKNKMDTLD